MRSKTKAVKKPKTAKASGVCSLCLSVRQLHKRDGYVHVHGFRNDPCKGSRLPPLSSVMAQQRVSRVISSSQRDEDSAEGCQSSTPADLHFDTGQGTTGSAEIEVDDGGVDGEANTIEHPRQRRGMVMKHIPKGARFACSKALTDILQSIIGKPSEIEHWNRLLCFTSNILKQPKRLGRRRNMASVVKNRIDNREFQKTDARTKNMKENHPVREICSWRRSMQNWKTGTSERPHEFSVARIIQSRRLRKPLQQCRKNTHLTNGRPN